MELNAGKLDKRVEILRVSTRRDKNGYTTETVTVLRRPWAQFSRTSGTEALRSGADMGETRARFVIRAGGAAISRKDRVRYHGADYEVEYVNEYGDSGEYVELMTKLVTAGG